MMTDSQGKTPVQSATIPPGPKAIARPIGYGLLILALFNLVDILLPPQFMNPTWELQTVQALVESVPLPLLGLGFIFYGDTSLRQPWERFVAHLLTWLCLVVGILFFLLIPLTASDTLRLTQDLTARTHEQYRQQVAQVDQVEAQLQQASNEDIANFLAGQGVDVSQGDWSNADLKQQMLARLTETRRNLQAERNESQTRQRRSMTKNAFKWILSSLVCGFLLIYIWQLMRQTYSLKGR